MVTTGIAGVPTVHNYAWATSASFACEPEPSRAAALQPLQPKPAAAMAQHLEALSLEDDSSDGWSVLGEESGADDDGLASSYDSPSHTADPVAVVMERASGTPVPAEFGDDDAMPQQKGDFVQLTSEECLPRRSVIVQKDQDSWVEIRASARRIPSLAADVTGDLAGVEDDSSNASDLRLPGASLALSQNRNPMSSSHEDSSREAAPIAPNQHMTEPSKKLLLLIATASFASGILTTYLTGAYIRDHIKRKKATKRLQQILRRKVSKYNNNAALWTNDSDDFVSAFFARRIKTKPRIFNAKDGSLDLSDYVERLLMFPSRL